MDDDKPESMTELAPAQSSATTSAQTAFSRDDWRPGEIVRGTGTGELEAGDVLFGAYEITGKLGEGGMGAVYSAKHLSLGGMRAIKVMSASLSSNLDAVERFHREGKALLDVHHPAVVRCHDLLRDEQGCIFLVMELIEGVPLSARVAERPLGEKEVRELGERIGAGLMAAHAQGVIHRDLSPDNVVLPEGRTDQAKLVDFGIAKILRVGEQTISAGFKGKLAYASPEQLGFYDGEIGPASDFFSLGLLLCGAALGQRIDMGKNFATAVEARRKPIEIPDGIPPALRPGLQRLLTLNPTERPYSMEGLFDGSLEAQLAARARKRVLAIAAGLVAGVGIGGLLLGGFLTDPFARTSAVSAPPPNESVRTIDPEVSNAPPLEDPVDTETRRLFENLRSRLIGARSDSLAVTPRFEVTPNPLQDGATYSLRIQAGCDCYPLVFFIDANTDSIDLLYPNPNEPVDVLAANQLLSVPSDESLYSFEAQAGTGIDRLKLLLLPKRVEFPAIASAGWNPPVGIADREQGDLLVTFLGAAGGDEFWSASPTDQDRLLELATLLDGLSETDWTAAETVLHVLR
ncbi:MAG: protein kinase [bacterium]|nr:protein kinase [bacterium]